MNRSNCHSLLRHCQTLKQLQQAHAQALVQNLHPHFQPLSCALLNAYANLQRTSEARDVFLQIPTPDLVSLTSFMSLHLQNNLPCEALKIFAGVVLSECRPDEFTVVAALTAVGQTADLRVGRIVHGMIYRLNLRFDSVLGNSLIDMYCKFRRFWVAHNVFDVMPIKDSVSWSTILNGYIKCLGLERASEFFEKMPERSTVSWTVMITGFVQGKQPMQALEFFRQMKNEGFKPTLITIVGVLSACADLGALDLGRVIHGYINKMNAGSDCTVYNALLDMYSKSGAVEAAYDIFQTMVSRDVYTWTTMLSGYAIHGDGKRAIDLFMKMLKLGFLPNEVTFLAVILACSHAGLINEGRYWFERMQGFYNITPKLEHYGCLVDLLGRAGRLKEAERVIKEMNVIPDAVIWRSILSACLVHGDKELAELAGMEIIKKEPDDDGVYVLLWNMYAASKRWDDAHKVRKIMLERKVLKRPGCSWIEVDGHVHEFLVGSEIHIFQDHIFQLLEGAAKHLKSDGIFSYMDDFLVDHAMSADSKAASCSSE